MAIDVPSSQRKESNDEVQKLLSKACIRYTHQNDELLRPSRVEEESLKESIKVIISTSFPYAQY